MKFVNLFIIVEIIKFLEDTTKSYRNYIWCKYYCELLEKYCKHIRIMSELRCDFECIELDILPYFIQDLEEIILNYRGLGLNDMKKDTIIYKLSHFKNVENISNKFIYDV